MQKSKNFYAEVIIANRVYRLVYIPHNSLQACVSLRYTAAKNIIPPTWRPWLLKTEWRHYR